tara:strand:- start:361 stop:618 length:258 start_codon:yes stop_codon:yes gene_type:complete
MKPSILILVFVCLFQYSFAKKSLGVNSISIDHQSPYAFSMYASPALIGSSMVAVDTIWPWKKRRSCHGGRKQKKRNKKRLKRSRA